MELITVDGGLYIERTAFSFLLSVRALNSHAPLSCWYQLQAKAEQMYGAKYKSPDTWSDGYLSQALQRISMDQAAFGVHEEYKSGVLPPIQQDEITLNGIPYSEDPHPETAQPDLSPIGVGSLTGAVARELCRRLEAAIAEDRAALRRRRNERHVDPAPESEH